ncbi:uncharacterized protein LOC132739477 [Ruditapes philippinarum]|uniref:uncharacterized protein LOC132739477 n=1 Tax=Ruditapes philippinarum TaxID=129788 RepID=UPI00295AC40F|nr:uncharacterized protein LOC132739477 [Ruditapes philippinarum]
MRTPSESRILKYHNKKQRGEAGKANSYHRTPSNYENSATSTPAPIYPQYSITASSHVLEPSERAYYTCPLDEGYGNVEEVSENYFDTNVLIENEEEEEEEDEEILIATPLELNYFEVRDNNSNVFNSSSHKSSTTKSDYIYTYSFSDSDSDSDTEELFDLFSDSSYDEGYSSLISPKSYDFKLSPGGNLPNFEEIEPVKKDNKLLKPPVNPLVSKITPTATATYSSESNNKESSFIFDKSHYSVTDKDDHKKEKSEKPVTAYGKETATFCSTNIQTALLSKITPDRKSKKIQISPFDDFLNMQSQRKTVHTEVPGSKSGHDKDIDVDLENFETEVGKAFEESVSEGSLMPLLKQELQCKIQVRRLSMGQSELVLEPEEPKVYKLTEDEIRKKQARLEQNRRSAMKSRHKARKYEQNLLKEIYKDMTKFVKLRKEVSKLQSLRDEYKKKFDLHMMSCTATSSSTPP